jgi:hypothetical protein
MALDRRFKFRQGLSSLYLPYYDQLCADLPDEWQPYQGLRTIDEQTNLWRQGREIPGPNATKERPLGDTVTDAQGGFSPHNYGCATDWTIFVNGKPQWMKLSDPRWKVYQNAIMKARLKWGGDWNMNGKSEDERRKDFPHNELPIACSWRHVREVYAKLGMRSAQEKIEAANLLALKG